MNPIPAEHPTPAERLAASREHLRLALHETGPARPDDSDAARDPCAGMASVGGLRSPPAAQVVIEAIDLWWDRHPLPATSLVAVEAVKAVLAPPAQRHPLLLVAGAFVAGGLLARARPWRWGFKSALFAGLLPQLLATSLAHGRRDADAAATPVATAAQPSMRSSKNA